MINIPENIKSAIKNAASETGVPEDLLIAFASIESGFDEDVISGNRNSDTGVQGLFQITRTTWNSIRNKDIKPSNRSYSRYSLDINEQARTAAILIKQLSMKYGGDKQLTAIAYNAGEGVADKIKTLGGINPANVRSAVQYYRSLNTPGFGPGKIKEVLDYPKRLAKALGDPQMVTASTTTSVVADAGKQVTATTKQESFPKYDPNKSLLDNLFSNSYAQVNNMPGSSVSDKIDFKKSPLVARIQSGLAHLRTAPKINPIEVK
jgi:hypothetical protein